MSHHEFAERILQLVAVAGDKRPSALLVQLDNLLRMIENDPLRQDWLKSSRVRAAVGEAYRELGDHAHAVEWLQLRQIELMVNSLDRTGNSKQHEIARGILKRLGAVDDPRLMVGEASDSGGAASAVSERHCLMGTSYLRQGIEESEPDRRSQLLKLASMSCIRGYVGKLEPRDHVDRRAYAFGSALLCSGLAVISGAEVEAMEASLKKVGRSDNSCQRP